MISLDFGGVVVFLLCFRIPVYIQRQLVGVVVAAI